MEAAQQWKFAPPQVNGQAAPSAWILHFGFKRSGTEIDSEPAKRLSRYDSCEPRRSRFGALRRHAVRNAASRMSGGTLARSTRVAPIRPHPPGTGENIFGSSSTIPACCSGRKHQHAVAFRFSESVAKIFPPTRKSAFPKCEPSTASGKLRAIRRKACCGHVGLLI